MSTAPKVADRPDSKTEEAKNLLIGLGGLAAVGFIVFKTHDFGPSSAPTPERRLRSSQPLRECGLCD